MTPLADSPPPKATSLADCPADLEGRPTMPVGSVSFPEAAGKPTLKVELALTDEHRAHGLMFRPTLANDEGMLFTFEEQSVHAFWMQNTCLALDMLFIDKEDRIVGVLEQVPPWNQAQRKVACPSTHVLEVRAGWAREHGASPGQKVTLTPQQ